MADVKELSYSALRRIALGALGAGSALALWGLSENWSNPAIPPAALLAVFVFVMVFSGVSLALAGPLTLRNALSGAVWLAAPVAALVSLAGLRYVRSTDLLDEPVTLVVAGVLVLVATPFLLVRRQAGKAWLDYAHLFDAAWTVFIRYFAAWVFVGIFWMVLFLSNQLLKLVDVQIIELILRREWLVFALTGGTLGLGLAVVYELRDTISPFIVLRLLRLLVPVVLLVVVVFLLAMPFQGQSDLFGEFSAAGILMGTAIVAITLINTALDRSDERAVTSRGLRVSTRLMAIALPVLAGLAVWAVAVRVVQYGWTPDRVLAMCAALFLLVYGVLYCFTALAGAGWMARIRRVNVVMALFVVAVAALWMTPVLNAQKISVNSQIKRFAMNQSALDQLPLWELAKEWGKAGQAGLDRLLAMTGHAEFAELAARIGEVRKSNSRFQFRTAEREREAPDLAMELAEKMIVLPAGEGALDISAFAGLEVYTLRSWVNGCRKTLSGGQPGCVMLRDTFLPAPVVADQAAVFYLGPDGRVQTRLAIFENGVISDVRPMQNALRGQWEPMKAEFLQDLLKGAYDVRPAGIRGLFLRDVLLVPSN